MKIDLEKIENAKGYLYVNDKRCPEPICVDDYIAYKEIEKELGVSLITLVKAIKEGIYIKNDKGEIIDVSNEPRVFNAYVPTADWGFEIWGQCPINFNETFTDLFRFKDYGKTWALTREELEELQ